MPFRLSLAAGLAVGYYLGAKAGRERYDQTRRWLEDAWRSRPVQKAQVSFRIGLERIRQQTNAVTGALPDGPGSS
jgi:hypothetical protein